MKRFWTLVCVLLPLLCVLAGCQSQEPPAPSAAVSASAHVISHRGASGEENEHTFAAYDLAIAHGSRYIEQDLVLSADGTLYVSHDITPERLAGEPRPFSELTDREIDDLVIWQDQHFLRMRDVFARYGDSVNYVIEVRNLDQAEQLFPLVEEFGLADHVIIQAWYTNILQRAKESWPDMPCMLLVLDAETLESGLTDPCVDIIATDYQDLTPELCDRIHAGGKQYCVWTLNSGEALAAAIRLDVDFYFTDYTARAMLLEFLFRNPG